MWLIVSLLEFLLVASAAVACILLVSWFAHFVLSGAVAEVIVAAKRKHGWKPGPEPGAEPMAIGGTSFLLTASASLVTLVLWFLNFGYRSAIPLMLLFIVNLASWLVIQHRGQNPGE